MSLLQELVQETAAAGTTGAHSIAGTSGGEGSLFGGGIIDGDKAKKKQRKMMRRVMTFKESISPNSEETNFDASDVISKIDTAEKKARANDDTVAFGLEDEEGEIVKVYVKQDQAEEFEKALAIELSGEDANDDDENDSMEIAEVLFKLKDRFEIVDVEWGTFEGDEEEEQEVEGEMEVGEEGMDDTAEGDMEGEGGDMEGEGGGDIEGEMEPSADESDAKSALQSVIDVMKADADAKKAEAEAKEAEANAKQAEYASKSAAAKVKQEEEILDMETHNKAEADKKKEAQQLAKLAKFKHETASNAETALSTDDTINVGEGAEEEEEATGISIKELSSLIMSNLRAN